jgi:1,4-dihydroxy-2-naphthoate octaprenyltransferase
MPVMDLFCICLAYTFLILTSFKDINQNAILLSSIIGLMAFDAHILQSIRDMKCDSECNIHTTVSYLGEEKSFAFFRIMVILTIAYTVFALCRALNVYYALVSALLAPIIFEKRRNPEILWNNFKILSGIISCFIIIGLIR